MRGQEGADENQSHDMSGRLRWMQDTRGQFFHPRGKISRERGGGRGIGWGTCVPLRPPTDARRVRKCTQSPRTSSSVPVFPAPSASAASVAVVRTDRERIVLLAATDWAAGQERGNGQSGFVDYIISIALSVN